METERIERKRTTGQKLTEKRQSHKFDKIETKPYHLEK